MIKQPALLKRRLFHLLTFDDLIVVINLWLVVLHFLIMFFCRVLIRCKVNLKFTKFHFGLVRALKMILVKMHKNKLPIMSKTAFFKRERSLKSALYKGKKAFCATLLCGVFIKPKTLSKCLYL